jgi:hypothetical protein
MLKPLRRDLMLPEFCAIRRNPGAVAARPAVRKMLTHCEKIAQATRPIPVLPYSLYQEYGRIGVRMNFDQAHLRRRSQFCAAALLALLRPKPQWSDLVNDLAWAICEESDWVPPEHKWANDMDLFSSETAFSLSEATVLLDEILEPPVLERIRVEIKRRALDAFLEDTFGWEEGRNNWAGVCEGATGATFLYLETDPKRLFTALNRLLEGLARFIDKAFLDDGGSSEGVGYWQYGLINFVAFSELLRRRTGGALDLLAHEKLQRIARYPEAVLVQPALFYNCSDCHGRARFNPGMVAKLAERTGVSEVRSLLAPSLRSGLDGKLASSMRNLLWWDGSTGRSPRVSDHLLPVTAVARLTARRGKVVLMAKAGHNCENHNHNDVGSFALYVDGEDLLCDPGVGLYDGLYFGPKRYENPICGSHGHSVPRVQGKEQASGEEHAGMITAFEPDGRPKRVAIEFASAYPVKGLAALHRELLLDEDGLTVSDAFTFKGRASAVEEAFVTYFPVRVRGNTARIRGEASTLTLRIAEPAGAEFEVEDVPVMLPRAKPAILHRIRIDLPAGSTCFTMRAVIST